MKKIIVVSGGYPDVGKGVFSSSLGYLLQTFGRTVQPVKFDGYMNSSSGTMNPYHEMMDSFYSEEEVFVLRDGYEADADSGYYERYLHREFNADSNITNGKLFSKIAELSTRGEILNYRSMRNLLKDMLINARFDSDFLLIEVGGTVGDRESEIFYECSSLLRQRGEAQIFSILLSPYFNKKSAAGTELSYRSKTTRQAYEKLWRLGLAPQAIVLRCEKEMEIEENDLAYIGLETGVSRQMVFVDSDIDSIYELPAMLRKQGIVEKVLGYFGSTGAWEKGHIEKYADSLKVVRELPKTKLAAFGKTMSCDSYVSLVEAVEHAGVENKVNLEVVWLDDAEDWRKTLSECEGLIVGEGLQFAEEKIAALKIAQERRIPVVAISFGFILMIKSLLGIGVEELGDENHVKIPRGKLVRGAVNNKRFAERLRIRSIPGVEIAGMLQDAGCNVRVVKGKVMEAELKGEALFVGMLSRPEYISHPMYPHPLLDRLVKGLADAR